MEDVYWELFLRAGSRTAEKQFPWQPDRCKLAPVCDWVPEGCADNEGGWKGEVVENGDKGSVSAQVRREQMREWRGVAGEGRLHQEPQPGLNTLV